MLLVFSHRRQGGGDDPGGYGHHAKAEHEHQKREYSSAFGDRIDVPVTDRCKRRHRPPQAVEYRAEILGLGCVLVARSLAGRFGVLSRVGSVLAWGLLAAGLLDALENVALIRVLLGSLTAAWPAVARWCAIPKFLVVAAGLAYVLVGAVIALAARARRGSEPWQVS